MAIRIKNPETIRLIDELAKLLGETKVKAITLAVREDLERARSVEGQGKLQRKP